MLEEYAVGERASFNALREKLHQILHFHAKNRNHETVELIPALAHSQASHETLCKHNAAFPHSKTCNSTPRPSNGVFAEQQL